MADLLTYGGGIPPLCRDLAAALPVLLLALITAGAGRRAIALLTLATIPTLFLHFAALPVTLPFAVTWLGTVGSLVCIGAVLVAVLRGPQGPVVRRPADAVEPSAGWSVRPVPAAVAVVAFALGLRAVLAWIEPGISDIPQASEHAARQLLAGSNPYVAANPYTVAGIYQYPAGSLLWHLPFVAVIGEGAIAGETFLAARAAAWAVDVGVVAVLAAGGVAAVRGASARQAGSGNAAVPAVAFLPAVVYTLHPTLIRETGLTAANDVLMGVAVAACAWLLWRGHHLGAAIALGLAVAVKPPAVVLVGVLLLVSGWRRVLQAGLVAAALQVPFLLWPDVGLHGLAAIAEPTARAADGYLVLRASTWWPVYAAAGTPDWLVSGLGAVAALAGLAVAAWTGWTVARRDGGPDTYLAAVALPLLLLFLLAPGWRVSFQAWMLPAVLLAVALPLLPAHAPEPTVAAET